MSAINDPNMVSRQYSTDTLVRIRQEIHEKYTVPKINFTHWVLSNIQWQGGERVLDVGCGNGVYYEPLMQGDFFIDEDMPPDFSIEYYGVDLFEGILKSHPALEENRLFTADAVQLPFADHSFDIIMANHMLYHVQDIHAAIMEFKRVLKPDGALLIATNSIQSMPEIQVLMKRAIILLTRTNTSQVQPPLASSALFALENGLRQLSRHFYAVMRSDLPSALMFREIEPLMSYIESTRDLREPQLPDDVVWEDVMAIMRQQITHLINHMGELPINKLTGVLVASDSGAFVREFLMYREKSTAKNAENVNGSE